MGAGERGESGEERLHHQHHPRPAPERSVVDLAVDPLAEQPKVDQLDRQQAIGDRRSTRLVRSGETKNSGKRVTTVILMCEGRAGVPGEP